LTKTEPVRATAPAPTRAIVPASRKPAVRKAAAPTAGDDWEEF
jgi:hypothetical protein